MRAPEQIPPYIINLLDSAPVVPHRSPLHDPYNDDLWWRVLPSANSATHLQSLGTIKGYHPDITPSQALNVVADHHEKLSDMGIKNPNVELYLSESKEGTPRVFMLDLNVTGISGEEFRTVRDTQSTIHRLGKILLKYVDWAEKQEFILWDIYRPDHYMYGTTSRSLKPEIYLIDTDPFLATTDKSQIAEFRRLITTRILK
jgi:hypothetical protein